MSLSYAKRKRIKSLAQRFLHSYDSLVETKDLSEMYNDDFMRFSEQMLIDLLGYKRQEIPEKIRHRPRKVGTRPPKRTVGTRPPRIGQKVRDETALKHHEENIEEQVNETVDKTKPDWYKKTWRRVMMEVHPDRIDIVSKDEIDKLERLKIASRMRTDESSELLVACANFLEVLVDLNIYEQERMLRVATKEVKGKIKNIHQSVQWVWGEAIVDNNIRLQIMKKVLMNSGINPPDDSVLLNYISKKSMEDL